MKIDKVIEQFINDENYRVSNRGYIYSRYSRQGHISDVWREMNPFDKQRYKFIKYKGKQLPVHRIVVMAYGGTIPFGLHVNHKDGCPGNNKLSNLEVTSVSANNIHRFRVIGHPPVYGFAKINFEIADQIREDYHLLGLSNRLLRQKYNLSKATISYILNDRIWK